MGSTGEDQAATFDYIIAGGGTAGVVVAARLSEDPSIKVLLIEAGADHSKDPLVLTPGLVAGVYGKKEYDWNFSSVPQPTLHGRAINQARGRMLGGCSGINFMMAVYPSRAILDAWGALGNKGWSFDELEPYFRKFATTEPPSALTTSTCRVAGHYDDAITQTETGPLQISYGEGHSPNNSAWFDTFANLGLRMTSDPRGGSAVGAFQNTATIDPKTKTRSFAVTAYLTEKVLARTNLTIWTEAVVTKILLESPSAHTADPDVVAVAKGVRVRSGNGGETGKERDVFARAEVILAAGTLQTPQLLELSGIGGRDILEKHAIPVVVDNPNVGEHLQDHAVVCQSFEVAPGTLSGDILRDPDLLNALVQQYQTDGQGPMGQSAISCAYAPLLDADGPLSAEARQAFFDAHSDSGEEEHGLVRKLLSGPGEPSVQFLLFPTQVSIRKNPSSMAEIIVPSQPENYLTIMSVLNHPFSRGQVHITSGNIDDLPVWDPHYNSESIDMEILARAVRFVETFAYTKPFAGLLMPPGEGKRMPDICADDLDQAREIVRQAQISIFHVCGSCVMKPKDKGGVVDGKLRVYGVSNLRIVDASIFPIEPLGNIQTTVYAVAEKAADIIKQGRQGHSSN
ncbi:glucose-methanol-choline oxidoreductase [Grosmannia clavigera kw1407]|uniref:Glucose-methanol-choline oxidoreductase n=1 Tax=Grosmannia clavigera (strain kw1407 / UAMH 11150) TaxID=655863 RepID=F0X8G2_GROCL|nr:glucose-methanol-choline oxidoreductase [Grosmannia clavigera kw1407]EFX05262.1 glucose-methanol-choline oxidoreductase [Grosmannia clavigera kw1407]